MMNNCKRLWRCLSLLHSRVALLSTATASPQQPAIVNVESMTQNITLHRNYSSLLPLDPTTLADMTKEERILFVQMEYYMLKKDGVMSLPEKVSELSFRDLAEISNQEDRLKFLNYLFVNERRLRHQKKEVFRSRLGNVMDSCFQVEGDKRPLYSTSTEADSTAADNCLMLEWTDQRMAAHANHCAMMAVQHGLPIVFDNSFDQHMTPRQHRATAFQFAASFGVNRSHREPFRIHLCNFDSNQNVSKALLDSCPRLLDEDFPMMIHKESYLDHFPRDDLVYITPHAEEEMTEFDHDAVYIIGNIVEVDETRYFSSAKARRENIRTLRIPVDRYMDVCRGRTRLFLDEVTGILLEMKLTGSWVRSLQKHVRKTISAPPKWPSIKAARTQAPARRSIMMQDM